MSFDGFGLFLGEDREGSSLVTVQAKLWLFSPWHHLSFITSLLIPIPATSGAVGDDNSDPAGQSGDSLCLLLSATVSYAIKMTRNSLDSPWLPAFLKKLLARNIKESLWNPQQMPGTDSTACVCSATLEGTDRVCSATLEGSEGLWSRIPLWRSRMDSSLADSTYPWSLQLPSNIWGLCLPGTFHIATTAPLKAPHPLLVPGQDGEHSALMLCSSSLREQGHLGECRRNRQSQVLMRIPKGALKEKSHREQAGC